MPVESPVHVVAPSLLVEAAKAPTWGAALRLLSLAVTDENVTAFKCRVADLDLDVSHLRWRRHWDDISTEELCRAAEGASTLAEVLDRLGLRPGGRSYDRLNALGAERGVALPSGDRSHSQRASRACLRRCSDDEILAAYNHAQSMADLLRRVGLVPKGGNYEVMRRRLLSIGLDPTTLKGQSWAAGQSLSRRPLEELLRRGVTCAGSDLIRRLLNAGIFVRECSACRLKEWLGQLIPLELDHINGVHDDNRLENLRLLCPNCHALTPTYRGRNVRRWRGTTLSATPE